MATSISMVKGARFAFGGDGSETFPTANGKGALVSVHQPRLAMLEQRKNGSLSSFQSIALNRQL